MQSQALGGVDALSEAAIVDTENVNPRLRQAGDWLPSDIATIRRVLTDLYALLLDQARLAYTWDDATVTLQAGYPLDNMLDPRQRSHKQVAIFIAAGANILLRRAGFVDIAVTVPAAHWVTLQQPADTQILLATGGPLDATMRYSDDIYGTVLP